MKKNNPEITAALIIIFFIISIRNSSNAEKPAIDDVNKSKTTVKIANKSTNNIIAVDVYTARGANKNEKPGNKPPAIVFFHGFMQKAGDNSGWGKILADKGFTVFMPSLKSALFKSNIDERLSDALRVIEFARNYKTSGNGNEAMTADTGIALMGYSSGGLVALRASSFAGIKTVIGLDAVLSSGPPWSRKISIPQNEAERITVPVLLIEAPPQSCNSHRDDGFTVYNAISSVVKARLLLYEGSHCDFTNTGLLCGTACGYADENRKKAVVDTAVAWLSYFLKEDGSLFEKNFRPGPGKKTAGERLLVIDMKPPVR